MQQFIPTNLQIITRHHKECKYKADPDWKRCTCLKTLVYTMDGERKYQATKQRTWAGAEGFMQKFLAEFSGGQAKPTTVRDAVQGFLHQKEGSNITTKARKKYDLEMGRFIDFCDLKRLAVIGQVTLAHLSEYRAGWEAVYPASGTRATVQGRLREFFRYCLHSNLLTKNTAEGLSTINVDRVPTMPLTKEQYTNLLATIPKVHTDSDRKRKRAHALIECLRHSGLAIQDAVSLKRSDLRSTKAPNGNEVWVIVTVRGKVDTADVFVPIPDGVAEEMRSCPNNHPEYFFWNTGVGKLYSAVTHWQHDLRTLFHTSGMPKGHPHQLRDTFACEMLGKGIPLELVSKMLGHSSVKITERHYAPWVKVRQDNLLSVVTATFSSPAQHLVD